MVYRLTLTLLCMYVFAPSVALATTPRLVLGEKWRAGDICVMEITTTFGRGRTITSPGPDGNLIQQISFDVSHDSPVIMQGKSSVMTPHDTLWNYADPAATELKFREVLATLSHDENLSEYLQLQTQLARTQSLQRKFDEAHAILDVVERDLPATSIGIEHVRYNLERGRTFNSSGKKEQAKSSFTSAFDQARQLNADFYIVDALHMLAIVAAPNESIALNKQAIEIAEVSTDNRARGWLGALYNNTGWSVFEQGDFVTALDIFERALAWRTEKGQQREIEIAKWSVARALRALGRLDEALALQNELLAAGIKANRKDGYVYEELAELYALRNAPRSAEFARLAYEVLSADAYLVENEPARLARLKEMGNTISE